MKRRWLFVVSLGMLLNTQARLLAQNAPQPLAPLPLNMPQETLPPPNVVPYPPLVPPSAVTYPSPYPAPYPYWPAVPPPPLPPPKLWCGGVEFGLSGSEGNAQNFKMRLAANAKRVTPDNVLTLDTLYTFAEVNGDRNENRWLSNGRYEWLFAQTPWSLYTDGMLELNEFRPYDFRIASHFGFGYLFLKTERSCLKGRAGAGTSREFGGPTEEWIPEAQFGLDFELRLTARQRFVSSADYYPDFGNFNKFRMVAKASYEILVDPDWNVTFKLGAQDIWDNHSRGGKFNDLDYFATVLWKF